MPNYKAIGIMRGVGKGLQDAGETLMNISLKKRQLEQEDKEFGVDMKIKNLQLEKYESQMDPETLKYEKDKLKFSSQMQKTKSEAATLELDNARRTADINKQVSEKYLDGFLDSIQTGTGEGMDVGGVEFDINKSLKGELPFSKVSTTEKTFRAKQKYEGDLKRLIVGEVNLQEMKKAYPTKTKEIEDLGYKSMLERASKNEITWEDVRKEFPEKSQEINTHKKILTPVERDPEFTEGTGGWISKIKSKFSSKQAEMGEKDLTVVDNIKNENDLQEMIMEREKYEKAGIDVDAILEYFGKK